MLLTVFSFAVFIIVVTIVFKKRINTLIRERFELLDKMEQMRVLFLKSESTIKSIKVHSEQAKKRYECEISKLQRVVTGMHYYVDALCNRNLSQLNSQDLHCFIECYREFDKPLFYWIEKNGIRLTNREMTICIFIRMGKGKQEILQLLHCSDGSYRTVKNRIKNKINIIGSESEVEDCIKAL